MKLASCSKCFAAVPIKRTSVIDGWRVCNDCKKGNNSQVGDNFVDKLLNNKNA